MKVILDAQKEFVTQAANDPGFNAATKNGEVQLNFQFEGFVNKLQEIATSLKSAVSETPLAQTIGEQFTANQDENMLSGFLEGLGLEDFAQKYVAKRGYEREKGEYVSSFMENNPAAQILTEESARAAAADEFDRKRNGTMPMGTQLVQPTKEDAIEAAYGESNERSTETGMFKDLEDLRGLSEKNLPMLAEIKEINEKMLRVLEFIAIEGLGGVGLEIPGLGDGGKKGGGKAPKGKGGKLGGIGKIASGAKGLVGGIGRNLPLIGSAIAVGSTGYDIYDREKQVEAGTMDRDIATKENTKDVVGTGSGLAGAAAGAKLGLMAGALTGPAAPVAAPVLSIVGGIAGFFLGDKIGRGVTEAVQNSPEVSSMGEVDGGFVDPMGGVYQLSPESPVVPQSKTNALDKGAGGSGVEINQQNTSNVNAPTTVINNNIKQMKSPRNEDPTFNRYTNQRAYP